MKKTKLYITGSVTLLLVALLFLIGGILLKSDQGRKARGQHTKQAAPFSTQSTDRLHSQEKPDPSLTMTSLNDAVELQQHYDSINENDLYPNLGMRLQEILDRRPDANMTASELLIQMKAPTAWQSMDTPDDTFALSEQEINDGRAFIRFNPTKIETLSVGDTLTVSIAQTLKDYQVTITDVDVFNDDNITWSGEISELEGPNQVSITQSRGVTAGGISTGDGHYTLQARGDAGWIVNTASLFKVNPGAPDYIKSNRATTNHNH